MADSIVSFFVEKLDTLVTEEGNLLLGVEEQLWLLQREFEFIKSFLLDAERKRRKSNLVEVWVTQIRDIAYEAEDVIDAYMLHLEQRKTMNMVKKLFYSWKKVQTLHKMGNQIEQINTRARRISTCRSDYNIDVTDTTDDPGGAYIAEIRRGDPTAEEIDVVGLKKESAQIVDLLSEEVPQRRVISIIGMGGLGKTTLAQVIYKNYDAVCFFAVRIWVTVSQEFQVRDILLSALKQLSSYSSGLETNEELKKKLCNRLMNQKYMVVIDDIWSVEAWDQISGAFPNRENGSRVILTTRNKEVALHADPSCNTHIELRLLNEDESWELFCKKVFQLPVGGCPAELEKLGKEIVKRCGGLPLAILVIGGVLMGKRRTHDAWSKVAESVSWYLSQDSNQCRQILTLSYSDLPSYLKPCFLYLGLFPEDFEINAEKLIMLWVAEGFVEARRHVNMEDVAEDYLEELGQRSMIQVKRRVHQSGAVDIFRVHDLLRDLAIAEGRKDRFIEIQNNNNPSTSTSTTGPRRLAIHSSTTSQEGLRTFTPNLRCLLLFQKKYVLPKFWDGTKMLRVLDLQGVNVSKSLPKEIGKLVFLRYLGMKSTQLSSLSGFIGNLAKLQTLDIQGTDVRVLSKSLWKLKNLRHLFVTYDCEKVKSIVGLSDFGRNLLTLLVSASVWMYEEDGIGLSSVLLKHGRLRSLEMKGKLVLNSDGASLTNCFPSTLTNLVLDNTYIKEDPSDVLGGLPTLKILYLGHSSYTGMEMVFRSGVFPQLQHLHMNGLMNLSEWRVEDGSIPILRHLKIIYLQKIRRLPEGLRNVTTLQNIELFTTPHLQNRVRENGEDWDIVKHIPSRHF